MIKQKSIKTRGKLNLSQYFQEFKDGDKVAIVREQALSPAFPIRIQGRTGIVSGKKGNAYIIKIQTGSMIKTYIIRPMHLKRLVQNTK